MSMTPSTKTPPPSNEPVLKEARFRVNNFGDVTEVAAYAASWFPDPKRARYGIHELLMNAIEHGNLAIGYDLKAHLLESGYWEAEIARRNTWPENRNKYATLHIEKRPSLITLTITDQGDGFDWEPFLAIDPTRLTDLNGRGIAMACALSFSHVEYVGKGNEVRCYQETPVQETKTP